MHVFWRRQLSFTEPADGDQLVSSAALCAAQYKGKACLQETFQCCAPGAFAGVVQQA